MSIKRASQGVQRIQVLNKDQNIPKQWEKYLSSGVNIINRERIINRVPMWSLGAILFPQFDLLVLRLSADNIMKYAQYHVTLAALFIFK